MTLHDRLMEWAPRLYVVATGAGAGIQDKLWQKPGASKFLAGCAFPYAREATAEFLGFTPDRFVAEETALALAQEAYMRACRCAGEGPPVGLGLTAAVATAEARRGDDRVIAAVVTPDTAWLANILLKKGEARAIHGLQADGVGTKLLDHTMTGTPRWEEARDVDEAEQLALIYKRPAFFPGGRRGTPVPGQSKLALYPGSWNPLHEGHRQVANQAQFETRGEVAYTLTRTSPHKGDLRAAELLARAAQFRDERHPLLLTQNDPLFVDKAEQYPRSTFVIGADTMARLLDPQWGDVKAVLQRLEDAKAEFLVAPRNGQTCHSVAVEHWDTLKGHGWLFDPLDMPEVPVSSTELRASA